MNRGVGGLDVELDEQRTARQSCCGRLIHLPRPSQVTVMIRSSISTLRSISKSAGDY